MRKAILYVLGAPVVFAASMLAFGIVSVMAGFCIVGACRGGRLD